MRNISRIVVLLALFCWLPSTLFAEVTYYHTDAMGTPMAMTDSTGKVVWQGDFYPFGEEYQIQATPNKNKRRFTGKEKDEESGLHYFGARYMDEASGRFISPDPVTAVDAQTSKTNTALLANPLRLNRYVYGLNNPHRYIDPDGNLPVFLVPALIGAAISYLSTPDVANAPKSSASQTFQSHGVMSIVAGAVLGGLSKVKRGTDFFKGTKYSGKVKTQMKQGDYHSFPESVRGFQHSGKISKVKGGDGVVRDKLEIPGGYRGRKGKFEFIKEPDGTINHRLFRQRKE